MKLAVTGERSFAGNLETWAAQATGILPRYLVPREGWLVFVFLALTLLSVVWAVENSRWVLDLPPLTSIALGALFTGLVLAKVRVPNVFLHPVGLVLGVVVVVWQSAAVIPANSWEQRLVSFFLRLYNWYDAAIYGGISSDPLPFITMVVGLAWLIGYFSAWFLFRSQQMWWGVVMSGIALLTNLSYAPGRLTGFFILFIVCAMLLAMRMNYVSRMRRWRADGIDYPNTLGLLFFNDTFWFTAAVLIAIWQLPLLGSAVPEVKMAWERVTSPWNDVEKEFDRLFSAFTSRRPAPLHSFGKALPLRGPVSLGDNVVFTVTSEEPSYWRAIGYDNYTGRGWITSETMVLSGPQEAQEISAEKEDTYILRKEITQYYSLGFSTDVFFSAGQPIEASLASQLEALKPARYNLDVFDASQNSRLPADVREVGDKLRALATRARRPLNSAEIERQLPADLKLRNTVPSGGPGPGDSGPSSRATPLRVIELERVGPNSGDVTALRSPSRLRRGQKYRVVSSISVAEPDYLRTASTNYPGWVRDRYLQLPPDLPDRVRELAKSEAKEAQTPYDKALAVETYLRQLKYDLNVPVPPEGRDAVDFFLFDTKTGYCDYMASAMAVMLRSLGVPARVASGYITGEYDAKNQQYIVRELNAHSWPEVYFPGYGWVEFEPTPAWPTIQRGLAPLPEDLSESLNTGQGVDDLVATDEFYVPIEGPEGSTGYVVPESWWSTVPLGLAAVLALALGAGAWAVWQRGMSHYTFVVQAHERMCRLGGLIGLRMTPQQTPREYAKDLGAAFPTEVGDISRITEAYLKVQYGKRELGPTERDEVESSWTKVRNALLRRIFHWK